MTSRNHHKAWRYETFLLDYFKKNIDSTARKQVASGAGLDKGDLVSPKYHFNIEAKNAAKFNIDADWEQAKRQALGDQIPILVVRHPKKPEFIENLAIMHLETLSDILANNAEVVEVEPTLEYQDRAKMNQLKTLLSWAEKRFGGDREA